MLLLLFRGATASSVTATVNYTEEDDVVSSSATVEVAVSEGGGNANQVRHLERTRRDDEQVMRLVIEAFKKLAA